VIVGAGLTGLFLATTLAERGRDVVVIEHAFGTGATTRSGGIVLGETLVGPSPQFDGCEESLRHWVSSRGLSCGLEWSGCMELLRNEALDASPIDWRDAGVIRYSRMVNGGVVDPAMLLGAVMAESRRAGATVADAASADLLDADAGGVTVSTNRGTIRARLVAMATDATLAPAAGGASDPWDERGVTVAIQTMPLAPGVRAVLGLRPHAAFYTDDSPLLWGRVMPDDSLLVGRELLAVPIDHEAHALSAAVSACGARLLARARGLHPALNDVHLKRAWAGPVVRTTAGIPIVKADPAVPGVTWLGGYGGHGIAQALRVAELAADCLQ
jgi:glycine/D-amino acid oxidase-like deaminating enzyme